MSDEGCAHGVPIQIGRLGRLSAVIHKHGRHCFQNRGFNRRGSADSHGGDPSFPFPQGPVEHSPTANSLLGNHADRLLLSLGGILLFLGLQVSAPVRSGRNRSWIGCLPLRTPQEGRHGRAEDFGRGSDVHGQATLRGRLRGLQGRQLAIQ